MKKIISKFFDNTLFLKDIKCIFCDDELDHFSPYCACETCLRSLPFNRQKVCQKCGEPLYSLANYCMRCKNSADRGFDVARAPFLYDGKIKQSVWAMKYYGKKYLAEYLSRFLYDEYVLDNLKCDLVIPVPLTAKKLAQRGYNQSELLCKCFLDAGLEVDTTSLIKNQNTKNQMELGYKDRQTNLAGAFAVTDKNKIKGKKILLVDDIMTTGATASEIARVLKKAKANSVSVLTLCHEMPPKSDK